MGIIEHAGDLEHVAGACALRKASQQFKSGLDEYRLAVVRFSDFILREKPPETSVITSKPATHDHLNLRRRRQKLEARLTDVSDLVPHSEAWLNYWVEKIDQLLAGAGLAPSAASR